MDLFHLNISQCLNNGACAMNYSLNTTYCLCDLCHEGNFCESVISRQNKYDTKYAYLVIYCFGLCISVLNKSISLELFIRYKSIRRTNCGIYLIIYSLLALLASSLLVADAVVDYNKNIFRGDAHARNRFHCVVGVAGYNTAVFAVLRRILPENNQSSFR